MIHADALAQAIGASQELRNSFQPILAAILSALDAPAIFMRSKSLRALGQILASDPNLLATVHGHLFTPIDREADHRQ